MSFLYKLTIQYRGQGFQGWQIQPHGKTLQAELNIALEKITKNSGETTSLASGRTDAGVHAHGQVIRVSLPFYMDPCKLPIALNSNLHPALNVLSAEEVSDTFHPIRDAKSKEYRYFFMGQLEESLFANDFVTVCPFDLNWELMEKAAAMFVGEFDFYNFHTTGSEPHSTVREVLEVELLRTSASSQIPPFVADICYMRIKGKGFLKQMVRAIMGAVFAIGKGQRTLEDLEQSLLRHKDVRIGAVAPAHGLHLWQVWYK